MAERKPHDNLDIHAPGFARDPYPAYRELREGCPVMHSDDYGGFWLLSRYEDVRQAALDWQTYTSSVVGVTAIPVITPRTEPQLPIELDPPLHSRYRALVNPVFSAKRIEELRPAITAIVDELIVALLAKGQADLVADYAVPLSVRTLAAFTGLPLQDSRLWVAWINRMFNVHDREDGRRAGAEFGAYINDLIAERRRQPTGDFISLLMDSAIEGHRLSDKEIHSFCTVVFGAGFETTADALSVTFHYLAEHPEAWEALKARPELVPTAVEEFLRFISPIQIFGRNTTKEVELHGRTIPKGDVVALGFGSANHDPAVFPQPERCVLERSPNRHLAFGAGVHLCLGAPVARLELGVTLARFLERVGDIRITGPVEWKMRGDRRGIAKLPAVIG